MLESFMNPAAVIPGRRRAPATATSVSPEFLLLDADQSESVSFLVRHQDGIESREGHELSRLRTRRVQQSVFRDPELAGQFHDGVETAWLGRFSGPESYPVVRIAASVVPAEPPASIRVQEEVRSH
jgi:hypothetical protein